MIRIVVPGTVEIDTWRLHYQSETWVSVGKRDALSKKRFYFREFNDENYQQMVALLQEIQTYFGFKLVIDKSEDAAQPEVK